jgi:hypothetical protein
MLLVVRLHLLLLSMKKNTELLRRHVLDAFVPPEAQDASRWRRWTDERLWFLRGLVGDAVSYSYRTRLFSCSFPHAHCNAFYSTQLLGPASGLRSSHQKVVACLLQFSSRVIMHEMNKWWIRKFNSIGAIWYSDQCTRIMCIWSVYITVTVGSLTDALVLR